MNKLERFNRDDIFNIFNENENIKKNVFEFLSNFDVCVDAYKIHDEWFSDLGWRIKETKDVVVYTNFTDFTADQNRLSLMIHLNGIAYAHIKMLSDFTYQYYSQLNFKFDRLCELIDSLCVSDLTHLWNKFNKNIDKVCSSFSAFCLSIAKSKHDKFNLEMNDAYQLCMLGVLKAARSYRFGSNIDFVKYANYLIHTELNRNRNVGECINIQAEDRRLFQRIKEYMDSYESRYSFLPSDKEIMNHFQCKKRDVYMAHVYVSHGFSECLKSNMYDHSHDWLCYKPAAADEIVGRNNSFSFLKSAIESLDEPIRTIIKSTLPSFGSVSSQVELSRQLNLPVRKIVSYREKGLLLLKVKLEGYSLSDFNL